MFNATKTFTGIAALFVAATIVVIFFGESALAFWAIIGVIFGLRVVLMVCNSLEARDRRDYNKERHRKRNGRH